MFSGNNVRGKKAYRARYRNRCGVCDTIIHVGNYIRWDASSGKYVHQSCAKVLVRVADAADAATVGRSRQDAPPPGLKPKTLATYRVEWLRYCSWAEQRLQVVPGRDAPWDTQVLWQYMRMRAKTCNPTTLASCFTMLAHFSVDTGFLLPNSKFDGGCPVLRKHVARIKKQLRIDDAVAAAATNKNREVHHCTALGQGSVELLLSAFRVRTEAEFNKLSRVDRHNLAIVPMQHTVGMRFGHFLHRSYTVGSFVRGTEGSAHLITD